MRYFIILLISLISIVSCGHDPDPNKERLIRYYLFCPWGTSTGCSAQCFTDNGGYAGVTNGSDQRCSTVTSPTTQSTQCIPKENLANYNQCLAICAQRCDTTWVYLAIENAQTKKKRNTPW